MSIRRAMVGGFTLVEIIVVVAIIGVLASVTMFSVSDVRENAKITQVRQELQLLENAMLLYKERKWQMPPEVDNCSLCGYRVSPGSRNPADWTLVIAELYPTYVSEEIMFDPWGNYYAYDNNFRVAIQAFPTVLCSVGPDGVLQTWSVPGDACTQREAHGDDICIFIGETDDESPPPSPPC